MDTVDDIEIHFRGDDREVLAFTADTRRGDQLQMSADGQTRSYLLKPLAEVPGAFEEVLVVEWREVRYLRLTTRPAAPQDEPVELGEGVMVSGRVPVPE
jgi:hypothetical protein